MTDLTGKRQTTDVVELQHEIASRDLSGDTTRARLLEAIDSGCGHESYRSLAKTVGRSLSTTYFATEQLAGRGKIERCSCGRGWLRRP